MASFLARTGVPLRFRYLTAWGYTTMENGKGEVGFGGQRGADMGNIVGKIII